MNKKENINDVVRDKYASVIAVIYSEHHVSIYDDPIKHNAGIIKSMVDFAIHYSNEKLIEKIKRLF